MSSALCRFFDWHRCFCGDGMGSILGMSLGEIPWYHWVGKPEKMEILVLGTVSHEVLREF